jgi:endoglucanase
MYRIKFTLFLTTIFFAAGIFITCSSSTKVNTDKDPPPVDAAEQDHFRDAFEINQTLGRGVNLGNALEAPNEGDWGMVIQEEFIQLIKEAGFESIRIPVRWNAHAGNRFPYAINDSFFSRVDEIIQWSLDRGLAVMLNIHHYNELMQQPQQHRDRFLKIWDQIATHYKDYPEQLVFEILNEPHDNLTPVLWNTYLKEAINVVRKTNPRRVIVIGTANWGGFGSLPQLELPPHDRQLIATVHYYNPFQFTHQGASWAGPQTDEWLGTTWDGTPVEFNGINLDFDSVSEWAQTNNRPIHLGEFGAYSTADDDSRKRWTTAVRKASENRGFSWAYWEFGAGFGIYDRNAGQWRTFLLESLIPDSPELGE